MRVSRRSVIGVSLSTMIAGCSSMDQDEPEDGSSGGNTSGGSDGKDTFTIDSVVRTHTYKPDSGLSALGYIKFKEMPSASTVAIIQSIRAERSSCDHVSFSVSPQSGTIGSDDISVSITKEEKEDIGGCVANKGIKAPVVEAIEIEFVELPVGQDITVSLNESNISERYTITGESNTESYEPINVPDSVQI